MRYLCCADLHLGAGADLGEPGERLREQAAVWKTVLDLAVERGCDAILFAGDAFHRNKPTPDELLAFAQPLADCPIPVFAINGNSHDFVGVDRAMAVDVVHNLSDTFTLDTKPTLFKLPGGAALACLPWTPVARLVAAEDGGDIDRINDRAAGLLVDAARQLVEVCEHMHPGASRILITHFAISGDWDGISEVAREPVLPLAELERLGFDAIVAGHFHRRQELATDPAEPVIPIFYCGSPAPLNFGEGGYEHGCWILESHEALPGIVGWGTSFIPIRSRPFVTLNWDASEVEALHDQDPIVGWSPGFPAGAYVKLRYTATERDERSFDHGRMREVLESFGAHRVWIEPTIERVHRDRGVAIAEGQTRMQQLEAYLEAAGVNGDEAPAMLARAERYLA